MPKAAMKIRCYQCGQLLGMSRSKAGTVIACPKCSAELTVPGFDAFDLAEYGKAAVAVEDVPNPIEALGLLGRAPEETTTDVEEIPSEPAASPLISTTISPPIATDSSLEEIVLPAIRVEAPRKRALTGSPAKASTTNRDLLIPRSVVAAWSLLVLAALMFAFIAGLLAGHFLWKEH